MVYYPCQLAHLLINTGAHCNLHCVVVVVVMCVCVRVRVRVWVCVSGCARRCGSGLHVMIVSAVSLWHGN